MFEMMFHNMNPFYARMGTSVKPNFGARVVYRSRWEFLTKSKEAIRREQRMRVARGENYKRQQFEKSAVACD
jgi:hypothetical protein